MPSQLPALQYLLSALTGAVGKDQTLTHVSSRRVVQSLLSQPLLRAAASVTDKRQRGVFQQLTGQLLDAVERKAGKQGVRSKRKDHVLLHLSHTSCNCVPLSTMKLSIRLQPQTNMPHQQNALPHM